MVLNPDLAEKLRAHEDQGVRDGCNVLEGSGGAFDEERPRKCQDCVWAALFLGTVGFLLSMASDPKVRVKFTERHKYMDPFCVAIAVAVVSAIIFLRAAKTCTKPFVYMALLLGPTLQVIMGLALIVLFQDFVFKLVGAVCVFLGLAIGSCLMCCWASLIPFTVLVLQTVTGVIDAHYSMIFISLLGCGLSFAWWLICAAAMVAVHLLHADRINQFRESVPAPEKAILFLSGFLVLWGAMVLSNACQVACCGVFGRWYFGKDNLPGAMPVMKSTQAAFTTSFGSVCLGSLVVALFQAAEMVARQVRREAQEDCNIVVCIIALVMESILSCIGDIIEWFCSYAYVQCAVRGLGFFNAVRATYALCTFSNITLIVSNSLVDCVVFFGGFLCGVFAGLAAYAKGGAPWFGAAGFVLGFMTGASALAPLRSGALTLSVCWAENPGALSTLRPQLHRRFCLTIAGRGQEAETEMQAPPNIS